MCRDTETDLSRRLENEVLTLFSCSDRERRGAGVPLAGNKDLFAPGLHAGCCFPFAAHSALRFCDASCQPPGKVAHGIPSRGDPRGVFAEPRTPPTCPLRIGALQLTRWKTSISVSGWVLARTSQASLQRVPDHTEMDVPYCAQPFLQLLEGGSGMFLV